MEIDKSKLTDAERAFLEALKSVMGQRIELVQLTKSRQL